jgi:hypothetical protein
VRKTVHKLGAEPDEPQQLGDTLYALAAASDAVDPQRLTDIVEQGHARIERAERIRETPRGPALWGTPVQDRSRSAA